MRQCLRSTRSWERVTPQERLSEQIAEQIGGILVPQVAEEIVEVVQTSPQERIRHCIVERTVPHVVE